MNWDQIEGNWKQVMGAAREKWGDLTDDDLDQIAGKRDQFIGRIQTRFGTTREDAERQVDAFANSLQEPAMRY
jgi:uncharacterized protein YjbJ (UPF0337 family)